MDQKRIRELEHKINTDYRNTTGVVVLKEGIKQLCHLRRFLCQRQETG